MKLVIATSNAGKLDEIARLLDEVGVQVMNDGREVEEPGSTLEENALIKARAVAVHHSDTWVLADDSGLEVDALGGAPGVYSARYAGPEKDNQRNMTKLLASLESAANRSAQFRTVLALVGAGEEHLFEGVVRGQEGRHRHEPEQEQERRMCELHTHSLYKILRAMSRFSPVPAATRPRAGSRNQGNHS